MCKIGSELYGDNSELSKTQKGSLGQVEDEGGASLKRQVTARDDKAGVEYCFESKELEKAIKGVSKQDLGYTVQSNDRSKCKNLAT